MVDTRGTDMATSPTSAPISHPVALPTPASSEPDAASAEERQRERAARIAYLTSEQFQRDLLRHLHLAKQNALADRRD